MNIELALVLAISGGTFLVIAIVGACQLIGFFKKVRSRPKNASRKQPAWTDHDIKKVMSDIEAL